MTRRTKRTGGILGVAVAAAMGLAGWGTPPASATSGTSVSNVSTSIDTPSSAARALTSYVISFKTSTSGALSGAAGDKIAVTLPVASDLAKLVSSPVMVSTNQVGSCYASAPNIATCPIYSGSTVGASTTVKLALNGVRNPATAKTYTLKVATTKDTASVSSSYKVTPEHAVGNLSLSIAKPSSAAAARSSYALTFTTSATGGLSGATGSTITVTLPDEAGLTDLASSPVMVSTNQVGYCYASAANVATCPVYGGSTVGAATTVNVTLNGVTNPPTAQSDTLDVVTTSDATTVTSPAYEVTPAQGVVGLTATISQPSSAAGGRTSYALSFTTSGTGGLSGFSESSITVTLPAGTAMTDLVTSQVMVSTNQVGYCYASLPTIATCPLYGGATIGPDTAVSVTLNGVTNPPTAKDYALSVLTSSDTDVVGSPPYAVTAKGKVTAAGVSLSSTQTGAETVTYAVQFKTATGLSGYSGSRITITVPAGTGLSSLGNSPVRVSGIQVGYCYSTATTVVTCPLYTSSTVAPHAVVSVSLTGVKNPATTKSYTLKVSTTSDVAVVNIPYCVAAAGVPCIAAVAPQTGTVGTAVTIRGVNLAGATTVAFHGTAATILTDTATTITTSVPPGATTGSVTVTTAGGTATSPKPFTVI